MVSYVLIMFCDSPSKLKVGSLGILSFKDGYYYYVGSANCGMHRIKRHFKKDKKKRWHIDYITPAMQIVGAIILKDIECRVAEKFKGFERIKGFGCSDCSCDSHLFYSQNLTLEFLST
ncbi:MAG: DUF123 domain-containing protein [Archaeoglobales archaeon]|nr:DUF123 domain-containing protein [Archaeoglobales archaeon]